MRKPRGIAILGSTGSIGTQTLDVVRRLPGQFRVVGLSARANSDLLRQQVAEFDVPFISTPDVTLGATGVRVIPMEEVVRADGVELVVVATPGTWALRSTIAALEAGRAVATANKEVLVAAGEIVVATARRSGAALLPIDGEHSAVWQCLRGENGESDGIRAGSTVERIVLTASGGAFRDLPLEQLGRVTPSDALRHPVWQMGNKVTVDAATLANKAFEVIEAHWLFDVSYERIDVVLHRESVVHSIVQFVDGSSKAQLGLPDMRVPIQYALTYPERQGSSVGHLDITRLGSLTFAPVDELRYPAFSHILTAARRGGTYPAALSSANDVAVEWFMDGRTGFPEIADILSAALEAHRSTTNPTLDDVIVAEEWARGFARDWLGERARTSMTGV